MNDPEKIEVEQFVLLKRWGDVVIRVAILSDGTRLAEVSVDEFARRLEEKLLENLPPLSMTIRRATINEKVRTAFRRAWNETIFDMKIETARATR